VHPLGAGVISCRYELMLCIYACVSHPMIFLLERACEGSMAIEELNLM
jgi:hypothetical protein